MSENQMRKFVKIVIKTNKKIFLDDHTKKVSTRTTSDI